MRRPSFQFYPGDWQSNSNLRRCTHAERGAWIDVMCLLHDQAEYGQLRWSLKEIAQAIGAPIALLKGLVAKGVLKGSDTNVSEPFIYTPRSGRKDGEPVTLVPAQAGPLWYSSRMVKDEYVRINAGASTRFGSSKGERDQDKSDTMPDDWAALRHSPSRRHGEGQGANQGDGSSSSSSTSTSVISVPIGTGAAAPLSQAEVWKAAVDLLAAQGMGESQARAFIGKLTKELGGNTATLCDLVEAAVAEQPADARAWMLTAARQRAGVRSATRPSQEVKYAGAASAIFEGASHV